MLLPNIVQVTESISGSVVPLAMFCVQKPPSWNYFFFQHRTWKGNQHEKLLKRKSKRKQTDKLVARNQQMLEISSRKIPSLLVVEEKTAKANKVVENVVVFCCFDWRYIFLLTPSSFQKLNLDDFLFSSDIICGYPKFRGSPGPNF